MKNTDRDAQRARPRFRRVGVMGLIGLVAAVALFPWIASRTALRNVIVKEALAEPQLRVSTDSASFGWASPLQLTGLDIRNPNDDTAIRVARVAASKPWLGLWMSLPDVGRIVVDRPEVDVTIPEKRDAREPAEGESSRLRPTMTVEVKDATVRVRGERNAQPVIDLDRLNLTLRMDESESGGELTIEPITVFDHTTVTPELCDKGLQLVAPVLADAATVEGRISFDLTKFRVPLAVRDDNSSPLEIEGTLRLHEVSAGLKNSPLRETIRLVANILQLNVPDRIKIANDAEFHFHTRDGRVYHDGLAFGFPGLSPDFELRTSGSVGMDETLDLTVQAALPSSVLPDGPIARRLTDAPLRFHVSGTLEQPKVELPRDTTWAKDLLTGLLDRDRAAEETPIADAILDTVGGLLEERRGRENRSATPLLDRIRARQGTGREDPDGRKRLRRQDGPLLRGRPRPQQDGD